MLLRRFQKRSMIFIDMFVCIFFVLCLWIPAAQADGEEPFIGVIQEITTDTILVEVTQQAYSTYEIGEQVVLYVSENTRIVVDDPVRLKPVSKDLFSTGTLVEVKPNTLSDKVEADTVLIIKRRVK